MSWNVYAIGKPGPALKAKIDERFQLSAKHCSNIPAEEETVKRVHGVVAHILDNSSGLPLKISAHGSVSPYNGGTVHAVSLNIETLFDWTEDKE